VAAVLGCAGGVVAMTRPQKMTQMQQMLQMAHTGHAFMQAVTARALLDTTHSISVNLGFTFAPEGVDPNAMSMKAYLQPEGADADKHADGTTKGQILITFKAQAGKAAVLKEQFEEAFTKAKEHFAESEAGPPVPPAMLDAFKVLHTEGSDKVDLQLMIPMNAPKGDEEKLKDGMAAKPTLTFGLSLGRDFGEIVENSHGCPTTLPAGFKVSATTKLAVAVIDTLEDTVLKEMRTSSGDPVLSAAPMRDIKAMIAQAEALEAFSSFSSNTTVRYNTEAIEAATCDAEESEKTKKQHQRAKEMAPHMLRSVLGGASVKAMAGLSEYTDSLHSIRYLGLPSGYEFLVEFTNFKLTPVITELLGR